MVWTVKIKKTCLKTKNLYKKIQNVEQILIWSGKNVSTLHCYISEKLNGTKNF